MSKTLKVIFILSLLGNLAIIYVGSKALEYRSNINHFLEKYQKVSQEFSARDIYYQANKAISVDSTSPNRIVFFGTQVIKNYDLSTYFPEYDVVNRGVEGQRVSGYLLRFKSDVINLKPKAVIIEISSYNFRSYNSIEEIEEYTELLAQLARYNQIEPVFSTVITPREEFMQVVDYKELGDYNVFDSVKTYNSWLEKFCLGNNIYFVDSDKLLSDTNGCLNQTLSANLIEPNTAGYEIITKAIKEVLTAIENQ